MTAFVLKVAYLSICPTCRQAGIIVCADGTTTKLCATQSRLVAEVGRLAKGGKIIQEEMLHLKEEISSSGLPYRNDSLDAFVDFAQTMQSTDKESAEETSTGEEHGIRRSMYDEFGQCHSVN